MLFRLSGPSGVPCVRHVFPRQHTALLRVLGVFTSYRIVLSFPGISRASFVTRIRDMTSSGSTSATGKFLNLPNFLVY